ncbi:MAG: cohesin domain-containing protein [Lachnospiraceae bacterium]|nr:cohesin domain-containing protein [Lachnospiraceae bacterium]
MKRYMNKKLGIVLKSMAVAVSIVLLFSVNVFAGTVTATGDKETAAVGDTYTVNIVIDGAEGAAVAPDVSVHYDVNRLEFVSCTGEYGGGGGGLVTINSSNADLTFNILSGGQADVDVFATFDGDSEPQIVTATVMVDGEDTAKINENAREDTGTGIEAGTVATADGKYVSSVFADEFMPVGFSKTTVTYEEQMVEAAQFDMGGIVLLYVTDADGNNGNFDMYDQTTGELSDFLQISGIENRFIIALKAGPDVSVPDGFTKATLNWNSQTLEAYAYTGEAGEAASGEAVSGGVAPVDINDFFLIYAISSEGNKGWYMYDQNEGTYQRYVQNLHTGSKDNISGSGENLISKITSPGADSEEGGVNVMLIIVIACAVLLVALIITVIIMAVKLHEFNSYEYIDEDDYEGEDSYEAPSTHVVSAYGRAKVSEEEPDDYLTRLAKASEELSRENHDEEKEEEINTQSSNKSDNIEIEEETHESESIENSARSEIPEGFVVRNKAGRIPKEELDMQNRYERDDEYELFSPRDRNEYDDDDDDDDDEDDFRRLSRAEKKALKAEKKARKKEEKRLKKEYGEYGPVDWESWQNGIERGEKTAAAHINKVAGVDEGAVRREAPIKVSRVEREEMPPSKNLAPKRPVQPEYEEYQPPKDNPMEMMRGIPANDNKAPVQAKPVQQFDFDDDFEFEFLDLDEDDE